MTPQFNIPSTFCLKRRIMTVTARSYSLQQNAKMTLAMQKCDRDLADDTFSSNFFSTGAFSLMSMLGEENSGHPYCSGLS